MHFFFLYANKMWKPLWSSQFYVHIDYRKDFEQTNHSGSKNTTDKTNYTPNKPDFQTTN